MKKEGLVKFGRGRTADSRGKKGAVMMVAQRLSAFETSRWGPFVHQDFKISTL